jgi:peroxiredoxin
MLGPSLTGWSAGQDEGDRVAAAPGTAGELPAPSDDGAAAHLLGRELPDVALLATDGRRIELRTLAPLIVIYCYPMTGRPGVALPEDWAAIPGAKGCTPQTCAFRDHYAELRALGAEVVGLSVQPTEDQQEMVGRLGVPYPVVSDADLAFQRALELPTFEAGGMTLLKRLTIVAEAGRIVAVHYPVFPSDSDPAWVIDQLTRARLTRP